MTIRWRPVNAALWVAAIVALVPLVVHLAGIVAEFVADVGPTP